MIDQDSIFSFRPTSSVSIFPKKGSCINMRAWNIKKQTLSVLKNSINLKMKQKIVQKLGK